ncbi:hypothetical protein J416_13961 [Gracilibacillus halophilus YIM-C55.5]|uniref:Permease n=1 Tax=Gracilibacillus halophilus YIM-C55.5 TaxID=1308866 RepID=N4W6H8_9BACI|nr:hypothetical protein [Gracilibacillus halophilus]ENH95823.1 hypothetical protein J416_13961 [Gracilibacillus halophilus YIM-C55.5]
MEKQYDRKLFLFFGVFFVLLSVLFNWATISTGAFPAGHDVLLIALAIIALCNAYLAPQFIQNDERTKMIRARGMFVSYYFVLGYMIIMLTLLHFHVIEISAYQAVSVLAALTISTVFLSFVILSRKY